MAGGHALNGNGLLILGGKLDPGLPPGLKHQRPTLGFTSPHPLLGQVLESALSYPSAATGVLQEQPRMS